MIKKYWLCYDILSCLVYGLYNLLKSFDLLDWSYDLMPLWPCNHFHFAFREWHTFAFGRFNNVCLWWWIDYTFIPNDVSSPGRVTKKLGAMLSEMEEDRQKVFMHKVKAGASSVSVKREDENIFYVRDINEGGFPAGEPGPGFAWAWRMLWPEGEESWCPAGLYIVCTKKVTVNGITTVLVRPPLPSCLST